jgi:DNA adenine methylase
MFLPKIINKISVPPVKCQGIKTKLVDFISQSIKWNGEGKWIEPFLGSGVVLFNIRPKKAIASDTNKHIINLYKKIQSNKINGLIVKEYLAEMSFELQKGKQEFYNKIRDRFNKEFNTLDFIFLNRSCFNGVMRFNSKGKFNVPFGHKPERFRQAYITKIINQLNWVYDVIKDKEWEFKVSQWQDVLMFTEKNDFVYLDPPYIGRHTDYFNSWTENEANELSDYIKKLPCGFALSMWLENKYRRNEHIDNHWNGYKIKSFSHFYHVGSTEDLRNEMQEALIISSKNVAPNEKIYTSAEKISIASGQYSYIVADKKKVKYKKK